MTPTHTKECCEKCFKWGTKYGEYTHPYNEPQCSCHTKETPVEIRCPYCNNIAEWVENKEVYGKNYGKSYMCYFCRDCDAYVGCHQNSRTPLGTMANKATRAWRMKAHAAFDPLWKTNGWKRNDAYRLLSDKIGREIHIGESDIETCKKIIKICEDFI